MAFQKGELVKCINPIGALELGGMYWVLDASPVSKTNYQSIRVMGVNRTGSVPSGHEFDASRFEWFASAAEVERCWKVMF